MNKYKRKTKPNFFDVEKSALKTELDFPGMWEKLTWEFLGRLRENNMDKMTSWVDFEHIKILGKGGFGKVVLSKHKLKKKFFALKVMEKAVIVKLKQLHIAFNEKNILSLCNFKFMLRLYTAFQTNDFVCFCLELAPGGDLFEIVSKHTPFDASITRFYSGQVILGLQYMHTMKIVYRDLKPENLLLSGNGYIKLADMGFAKLLHDHPRTYTFCGTPEYIAPEIILNKGYGIAIDWWSFGCMVYEFLVGMTPFYSEDQMKTFKNINKSKYHMPSSLTDEARSLIRELLEIDTTMRIGNLRNGALDVRYHSFYKHLDWVSLFNQNIPSPFPTKSPDFSKFEKDKEVDLLTDKSDVMLYAKEFDNF